MSDADRRAAWGRYAAASLRRGALRLPPAEADSQAKADAQRNAETAILEADLLLRAYDDRFVAWRSDARA